MINVQNDARIIYSADNKLRVGMEAKEVYYNSDKLELFNFADKNEDGIIDENEIRRYDGPILLVEEDDEKKQRFIGHYHGYRSHGCVSGKIITTNEFEFYPGLKYEEVANHQFNMSFRDLDLDSNGVLSAEELKAYEKYRKRKEDYDKKQECDASNNSQNAGGKILGPLLGAAVGASTFAILDEMINRFRIPVCGAFVTIGALAGFLAARLCRIKVMSPEEQQKLNKEYSDVLAGNKQYQHIYKE